MLTCYRIGCLSIHMNGRLRLIYSDYLSRFLLKNFVKIVMLFMLVCTCLPVYLNAPNLLNSSCTLIIRVIHVLINSTTDDFRNIYANSPNNLDIRLLVLSSIIYFQPKSKHTVYIIHSIYQTQSIKVIMPFSSLTAIATIKQPIFIISIILN